MALYTNLVVGKPKNSEVEITGAVPPEVLNEHMKAVLEEWRRDFELPGFRKGNVPLEMFKAHVHTHRALEEAAERVLEEAYPEILKEANLEFLGRPQVALTKLAEGNPAEFKIMVAVKPEVKLPNYKKIAAEVAKKQAPVEVSDKELEDVVNTLRKLRAAPSATAPEAPEGEKPAEPKTEELPPLTDEFVKTLGKFENVEEFKTKLKENIALEKTGEAKKALREELAAKLADASKMDLPPSLVEGETEEMLMRLKGDLEQAGLSLEDYLKKINKTEEDIVKEERTYAERQLKTRFILEAIAEEEKIAADPNDIRVEAELIRERYPDIDPVRVESYVANLMKNEKVLEFLENQGDKKTG